MVGAVGTGQALSLPFVPTAPYNQPNEPWKNFKINTAYNLSVCKIGITVGQVHILSPFAPKTDNIILEKYKMEK